MTQTTFKHCTVLPSSVLVYQHDAPLSLETHAHREKIQQIVQQGIENLLHSDAFAHCKTESSSQATQFSASLSRDKILVQLYDSQGKTVGNVLSLCWKKEDPYFQYTQQLFAQIAELYDLPPSPPMQAPPPFCDTQMQPPLTSAPPENPPQKPTYNHASVQTTPPRKAPLTQPPVQALLPPLQATNIAALTSLIETQQKTMTDMITRLTELLGQAPLSRAPLEDRDTARLSQMCQELHHAITDCSRRLEELSKRQQDFFERFVTQTWQHLSLQAAESTQTSQRTWTFLQSFLEELHRKAPLQPPTTPPPDMTPLIAAITELQQKTLQAVETLHAKSVTSISAQYDARLEELGRMISQLMHQSSLPARESIPPLQREELIQLLNLQREEVRSALHHIERSFEESSLRRPAPRSPLQIDQTARLLEEIGTLHAFYRAEMEQLHRHIAALIEKLSIEPVATTCPEAHAMRSFTPGSHEFLTPRTLFPSHALRPPTPPSVDSTEISPRVVLAPQPLEAPRMQEEDPLTQQIHEVIATLEIRPKKDPTPVDFFEGRETFARLDTLLAVLAYSQKITIQPSPDRIPRQDPFRQFPELFGKLAEHQADWSTVKEQIEKASNASPATQKTPTPRKGPKTTKTKAEQESLQKTLIPKLQQAAKQLQSYSFQTPLIQKIIAHQNRPCWANKRWIETFCSEVKTAYLTTDRNPKLLARIQAIQIQLGLFPQPEDSLTAYSGHGMAPRGTRLMAIHGALKKLNEDYQKAPEELFDLFSAFITSEENFLAIRDAAVQLETIKIIQKTMRAEDQESVSEKIREAENLVHSLERLLQAFNTALSRESHRSVATGGTPSLQDPST